MSFPTILRGLFAIAAFAFTYPAFAVTAQVSLPGSIKAVDVIPPTFRAPHKAYISRASLRADELASTLDFEVVLQLRNFPNLQARVHHGDRISLTEMNLDYFPLQADYQKVVNWLVQQGFKIQQEDVARTSIFATGTVKQLQGVLSMKFGRVTKDGAEYTSAVSMPNVPADIGSLLVGINGLQPHLRMHRHIRKLVTPATASSVTYSPSQIATAYDSAALYNYNITGLGQTIAIAIDTYPLQSDLTTFWNYFGINRASTASVTFVPSVVSGKAPAPSGEETLDTEWSSSLAPGASVRVYESKDLEFTHLDQVYVQVYNDVVGSPSLNIHELTMSYGAAEDEVSSSQVTTDDQHYADLTAAGVTCFASTGDDGATDDTSGLTPEYPSSDPFVTGVGGTSLNLGSGGAYGSETVWNNSSGASGGGVSTYFARPSWQVGTGVNTSSNRQTPDVASAADPDTGCYIVLNGELYSNVGGTSWSSPTWAAFGSLLNQARANQSGAVLGLLGPYIYPLLGTASFHDITSGSNGFNGAAGYNATTGYDLCTGIGSPDVTLLAETLSGSTTLAPVLSSVASVQNHGGTPCSISLPLTGGGEEPRGINGSMQLVFTFVQPVVSGKAEITDVTTSAGAPESNPTVAGVSFSGNTMTVNLTGVGNQQDLTVEVSGINGTTGTDSISFGVLFGDVNGDGGVNAADVVLVRNAVGTYVGDSNFNPADDLNEDGGVNAADVVLVRNAVGTYLP